MKKEIHPNYNKVTLKFPKGGTFETYSAYNGGKEIVLDVDFKSHPAWTKKGLAGASANSAKVSQFNKKFGSLFSGQKSS